MLHFRNILLTLSGFSLIILTHIVLGQEVKIQNINPETFENSGMTNSQGLLNKNYLQSNSGINLEVEDYINKVRPKNIKVEKKGASFFLALKKPVRLPLFYDDASLFRFVSKDTPLTSKSYKPENLVSISGAHINEAGRIGYLRADAKESLLELARAFEDHFGEPLVVISGYRSAAYQERMWNLGKCNDTLCAPPGYSEHQLGLAVDLFEATNNQDFEKKKRNNEYIAWMKKNGHFYGWHQSYQKGVKIDGYGVEPWHWRYLGKEMATRLKKLDWTFTEYVRFQEAIERR